MVLAVKNDHELHERTRRKITLAGVRDQYHVSGNGPTRNDQLFSIARKIKHKNQIRFEVRQLSGRTAVYRLAPNIRDTIARVNVKNLTTVGGPVQKVVGRRNIDCLYSLTRIEIN